MLGIPATRARGTLVGSICAADPSAETALVACVLDADIEIASATGKRVVGAREFVLGPLETCLEDHEFATAVRFPHWQRAAGGIGVGFEEMAVRHGDFALVACAAQVQFDRAGKCARASLGIANVTTTPLLPDTTRLLGSTLTDVMIDEFCAELAPLMSPPSDHVADADYRRRIALGLSARALTNARDKALAQP